jgi:hypothetical protein
MEWQARLGAARLGRARLGLAGRGGVWQGSATPVRQREGRSLHGGRPFSSADERFYIDDPAARCPQGRLRNRHGRTPGVDNPRRRGGLPRGFSAPR